MGVIQEAFILHFSGMGGCVMFKKLGIRIALFCFGTFAISVFWISQNGACFTWHNRASKLAIPFVLLSWMSGICASGWIIFDQLAPSNEAKAPQPDISDDQSSQISAER